MRQIILLVFLIFFMLLQYRLWFVDGSVPDFFILKHKISQQKNINQNLNQQNIALAKDIEAINASDQRKIESAREKLWLIGQSETFYLIKSTPN